MLAGPHPQPVTDHSTPLRSRDPSGTSPDARPALRITALWTHHRRSQPFPRGLPLYPTTSSVSWPRRVYTSRPCPVHALRRKAGCRLRLRKVTEEGPCSSPVHIKPMPALIMAPVDHPRPASPDTGLPPASISLQPRPPRSISLILCRLAFCSGGYRRRQHIERDTGTRTEQDSRARDQSRLLGTGYTPHEREEASWCSRRPALRDSSPWEQQAARFPQAQHQEPLLAVVKSFALLEALESAHRMGLAQVC